MLHSTSHGKSLEIPAYYAHQRPAIQICFSRATVPKRSADSCKPYSCGASLHIKDVRAFELAAR